MLPELRFVEGDKPALLARREPVGHTVLPLHVAAKALEGAEV